MGTRWAHDGPHVRFASLLPLDGSFPT